MIIFVVSLLVLLLLGFHIGVSLLLSSVIYILFFTDFSLTQVYTGFFKNLTEFTLMAAPMFVLAGLLMDKSGIGDKLFRMAAAAGRVLPAGVGVATMLACTFFGAVCGSSVAGASAMGVLAIPEMRKRGYDDAFATGIVAVGGTLSILVPPSFTLILFGVVADVSIPRLFMGGLVPGLVTGLALSALIAIMGIGKGLKPTRSVAIEGERASSGGMIWAILAPVIILGGIYAGVVTPTEAAAIAVAYAFLFGVLNKKRDFLRDVPNCFWETLSLIGMLFLIMGGAGVFGLIVTVEQIPQTISTWVLEAKLPPWAFILIINGIYIILGMFLEPTTIIVVTVPLVVPLAKAMGMDPVQFGVMLTINMEVACVTPPVGFNLFVISSIAKVPIGTVARGSMPFIGVLLGAIATTAWFPPFVTWLPNLIMGR